MSQLPQQTTEAAAVQTAEAATLQITKDVIVDGEDATPTQHTFFGCVKLTKYGFGVTLLVLVAMIWVGASEWIQHIFGDLNYKKPYFLTYFNTAGFTFWNLGFLFSKKWAAVPWFEEDERVALQHTEKSGEEHPKPYTRLQLIRCALLFCPLWFFANVLFNYSLSSTSVASNTILSTTSSIWTLFLSRLALSQNINAIRCASVVLSVGGTVIIALVDESRKGSGNDHLLGDIFALVSAFFYATYTIVLRWCLPDDERYSMPMVFGAVGVWNILLMWPGLLLLHLTNVETFELPSWPILWPLALNALIGTNLSDVLWAKAVILTSPLVATLGLTLTTPFAMLADAIFKHRTFHFLYICGACIVTAGFALSNVG